MSSSPLENSASVFSSQDDAGSQCYIEEKCVGSESNFISKLSDLILFKYHLEVKIVRAQPAEKIKLRN